LQNFGAYLLLADRVNKFSYRLSGSFNNQRAGLLQDFDVSEKIYKKSRGDGWDVDFPKPDRDSIEMTRFNFDGVYQTSKEQRKLRLESGYSNGLINVIGNSGDFMIIKAPTKNYFSKFTYSDNFSDVPVKAALSYLDMTFMGPGDKLYDYSNQMGVNVNSYDFEAQAIKNISKKDVLVVGVNSRKIYSNAHAIYFNRAQNEKTQDFNAAFFNNEYSIIDNKLKLTLAGRFDKYDIPDISKFSPQAVIYYKHSENKTWRFNYSEAIRVPFLMEIYLASGMGQVLVPGTPEVELMSWYGNKNLDAPRAKTFDISYSTKLNNNKNLLDISLFTERVEKPISSYLEYGYPLSGKLAEWNSNAALLWPGAPTSSPAVIMKWRNEPEKPLKTRGIEVSLKFPIISQINGLLNTTFQQSEIGDQKVKTNPEILATAGINGKIKKWRFDANVNFVDKTVTKITGVFDRNREVLIENPAFFLSNQELRTLMETHWNYAGGSRATGGSSITTVLTSPAGTYPASLVELANAIYALELTKYSSAQIITAENPRYAVFNLNISRDIFEGKGTFNIRLKNLLNKKYKENPFGEELGGQYTVSISYNF